MKHLDVIVGQIVLILLGFGMPIFGVYIHLFPQIKMGVAISEKHISSSILWLIAGRGFLFLIIGVIFLAIAIVLQYLKRSKKVDEPHINEVGA